MQSIDGKVKPTKTPLHDLADVFVSMAEALIQVYMAPLTFIEVATDIVVHQWQKEARESEEMSALIIRIMEFLAEDEGDACGIGKMINSLEIANVFDASHDVVVYLLTHHAQMNRLVMNETRDDRDKKKVVSKNFGINMAGRRWLAEQKKK